MEYCVIDSDGFVISTIYVDLDSEPDTLNQPKYRNDLVPPPELPPIPNKVLRWDSVLKGWQAVSPKESWDDVWSAAENKWVPLRSTRSLQEIRSTKWEELKSSRISAECFPLTTTYGVFDADPNSQGKLMGAVQMAQVALLTGAPYSVDWTLADNSVVPLTGAQVMEVGGLLGTRTSRIHTYARALRAQLDVAESLEEVDSIVWAFG